MSAVRDKEGIYLDGKLPGLSKRTGHRYGTVLKCQASGYFLLCLCVCVHYSHFSHYLLPLVLACMCALFALFTQFTFSSACVYVRIICTLYFLYCLCVGVHYYLHYYQNLVPPWDLGSRPVGVWSPLGSGGKPVCPDWYQGCC